MGMFAHVDTYAYLCIHVCIHVYKHVLCACTFARKLQHAPTPLLYLLFVFTFKYAKWHARTALSNTQQRVTRARTHAPAHAHTKEVLVQGPRAEEIRGLLLQPGKLALNPARAFSNDVQREGIRACIWRARAHVPARPSTRGLLCATHRLIAIGLGRSFRKPSFMLN